MAANRRPEARMREEEDQTRTYSAETVDKLLHGEATTVKPQASAADEVTRVGEIPIEELIRAQCKPSNKGVGYEDVTRVYDLPVGEAKSESTSPRNQALAEELRVIIAPEPPKAHWGRWLACSLLIAAAAAGWVYRAPLGVQAQKWQASFVRGIGGPKSGSEAKPVVAVPLVTVSVSVSPADARIVLDGAPVTNPFTTQRLADKQLHTLVAEAPGYASLQRNVQFERDLTVVLSLAPLPQSVPSRAVVKEKEPVAATASEPAAPVRPARARATKKATATASDSEPAASSCSPPYIVDTAGIKTYKPECL